MNIEAPRLPDDPIIVEDDDESEEIEAEEWNLLKIYRKHCRTIQQYTAGPRCLTESQMQNQPKNAGPSDFSVINAIEEEHRKKKAARTEQGALGGIFMVAGAHWRNSMVAGPVGVG